MAGTFSFVGSRFDVLLTPEFLKTTLTINMQFPSSEIEYLVSLVRSGGVFVGVW